MTSDSNNGGRSFAVLWAVKPMTPRVHAAVPTLISVLASDDGYHFKSNRI